MAGIAPVRGPLKRRMASPCPPEQSWQQAGGQSSGVIPGDHCCCSAKGTALGAAKHGHVLPQMEEAELGNVGHQKQLALCSVAGKSSYCIYFLLRVALIKEYS